MLIVNADDWGYDRQGTDRILSCHKRGRTTSASAMVFMDDSERSAELALRSGLEVGLHLNFTDRFTGGNISSTLCDVQSRISRFLLKSKYSPVLYNPLLKRDFEYVFRRQYDEFTRLYGKVPAHVNGHRHMHLCTNILVDGLIAANHKVRRNFSFVAGEKNLCNRVYRRIVDLWLERRYICTDLFFSIAPIDEPNRLARIIRLSTSCNVELMVHPQRCIEYEYLMGPAFAEILRNAEVGAFGALQG